MLPQSVLAGVSWRVDGRWVFGLQADWINWSNSFNTLPVYLTNGTNAAVNGLLNSSLNDRIPVFGKDQYSFRGRVERLITENISIRGGYAHAGAIRCPDRCPRLPRRSRPISCPQDPGYNRALALRSGLCGEPDRARKCQQCASRWRIQQQLGPYRDADVDPEFVVSLLRNSPPSSSPGLEALPWRLCGHQGFGFCWRVQQGKSGGG